MGDPHPLTARETEILHALCSGLTAQEVGERLGLSMRGVSSRRSRIYQKLGAQGLAEACFRAGVNGEHSSRSTRPPVPPRIVPHPAAGGRRRVRTFPIQDHEFRAFVRTASHEADPDISGTQLQDRLREVYPSATVRRRQRGGASHEEYWVFRGAQLAEQKGGSWWITEGGAWFTIDDAGIFVDVSPDAQELFHVASEEKIGRSLFEPAVPRSREAQEDIRRFWDALRAQGSVRSSMRVPRMDGIQFDMEFYAEANRDGVGRHRVIVRPVRTVGESDRGVRQSVGTGTMGCSSGRSGRRERA